MYIEKLNLINFKNYEEADLQFSPNINIFLGDNGAGKTNLLDAIHCLSLTKSAFHSNESYNIKKHERFFSLLATFRKENKALTLQYDLQSGQKKVFRCNNVPYERITDHIGKFPVVLIAPYDTDVFREGSEERRKFFDAIFSQIDSHYLLQLISYNQLLKQRNALLKQFAESGRCDDILLESYNERLLPLNASIAGLRQKYLDQYIPYFMEHYQAIAEKREAPSLQYQSTVLSNHFEDQFRKNKSKDLVLQRTTLGVHRDDVEFKIDEVALKTFASQGQQKSFLIALKLAQFDLFRSALQTTPILLMDDIFDKLDDFRIGKLIQMVQEGRFGQVFITDARPERTEYFFQQLQREMRIFTIENGNVQEK
ncbi:MAG: DNA replication/repair protein RecF [Cytophagaceae bacterium]|jgi:DNA replication and repair protein RecF|nr:DNA replication/repair protein RecF [Cytophagaceae bacterium]